VPNPYQEAPAIIFAGNVVYQPPEDPGGFFSGGYLGSKKEKAWMQMEFRF
jgi:hypothetical protein